MQSLLASTYKSMGLTLDGSPAEQKQAIVKFLDAQIKTLWAGLVENAIK